MTLPDEMEGAARSEAIFVDANIPMYAAGRDPKARQAVAAAVRHAVQNDIPLVTSAEVFQEVLHRYSAQREMETGRTAYRFLARICSEVLPVEERHTALALELLRIHQRISARDALHAAVMEVAGIHSILTEDRHFDQIPGIRRVAPAELASER